MADFNEIYNRYFSDAYKYLALRVYDQGKIKETNAAGNKRLYQSDQLFVQAIEMVVPENSMIYQLPYKQFPETPNINKLTDYDLFREYIHSNSLKWSYGAIKGREGDNWLKAVSELPLESMIQKIALAGFKGIAFDRVAYLDNGTELENKISTILDQKAIVSSMGDLVFFSLTDYYENLVNKYTQDELQIITSKALAFPVQILWKDGFYEEETDGLDSWRWAKQVATIELNNSNAEDKTVKITFRLATGSPEYSSIEISGLIEDSKNVNNKANFIEKKINVPPGMSEINFISGAKQLVDDLDKRSLFFRIYDFNIKEL